MFGIQLQEFVASNRLIEADEVHSDDGPFRILRRMRRWEHIKPFKKRLPQRWRLLDERQQAVAALI